LPKSRATCIVLDSDSDSDSDDEDAEDDDSSNRVPSSIPVKEQSDWTGSESESDKSRSSSGSDEELAKSEPNELSEPVSDDDMTRRLRREGVLRTCSESESDEHSPHVLVWVCTLGGSSSEPEPESDDVMYRRDRREAARLGEGLFRPALAVAGIHPLRPATRLDAGWAGAGSALAC
jgi:hypothetical protein